MPSELCTTSLDRVGLAQYAPKLNNLHCVWVDQLANANVSRDAKLRLALLDELCPYPGHRCRLESWLAGLEPSAQHEKSAQPPSSLLQPRLWQRSLDQLRNSARHRGKDPVFDPNCQSAPDPGLPSKVRVITEGRCTRRCMFTDGAAHSRHERNETIQAERQKRWTKAQNEIDSIRSSRASRLALAAVTRARAPAARDAAEVAKAARERAGLWSEARLGNDDPDELIRATKRIQFAQEEEPGFSVQVGEMHPPTVGLDSDGAGHMDAMHFATHSHVELKEESPFVEAGETVGASSPAAIVTSGREVHDESALPGVEGPLAMAPAIVAAATTDVPGGPLAGSSESSCFGAKPSASSRQLARAKGDTARASRPVRIKSRDLDKTALAKVYAERNSWRSVHAAPLQSTAALPCALAGASSWAAAKAAASRVVVGRGRKAANGFDQDSELPGTMQRTPFATRTARYLRRSRSRSPRPRPPFEPLACEHLAGRDLAIAVLCAADPWAVLSLGSDTRIDPPRTKGGHLKGSDDAGVDCGSMDKSPGASTKKEAERCRCAYLKLSVCLQMGRSSGCNEAAEALGALQRAYDVVRTPRDQRMIHGTRCPPPEGCVIPARPERCADSPGGNAESLSTARLTSEDGADQVLEDASASCYHGCPDLEVAVDPKSSLQDSSVTKLEAEGTTEGALNEEANAQPCKEEVMAIDEDNEIAAQEARPYVQKPIQRAQGAEIVCGENAIIAGRAVRLSEWNDRARRNAIEAIRRERIDAASCKRHRVLPSTGSDDCIVPQVGQERNEPMEATMVCTNTRTARWEERARADALKTVREERKSRYLASDDARAR